MLTALLFTAVATGVSPAPETSYSADPARPNVLFLIADDLNCDLGCYGHPRVQSPHIDRLAETAVRFERAYCQVPLCSPSRTSMLTGRSPAATQIYGNPGNRVPNLDAGGAAILNKLPYVERLYTNPGERPVHFRETVPDTVTLPQAFKNAGYFSARVGKLYHYNVPGGVGRVHDIGTDGLDDPASWHHVVNPAGRDVAEQHLIFSLQPGTFGGTISWMASEGTDLEQTDGLAASATIAMLNRSPGRVVTEDGRNSRVADGYAGQPFFIACGFYRPHTPYVALKSDFEMYPADETPLPTLSDADRNQHPASAYLSHRSVNDRMSDDQRRQAIAAYHASITLMDRQVGRVLGELDRLGLADSTIVVFTSDHGYHLYDHGLWMKQSLFENSARVPLLIRVPAAVRAAARKTAGTATEALAGLIDLYPTLTELAGLDMPDYLDGQSLIPVLTGEKESVQESVLSEADYGRVRGRSVRTDRYRYTQWVNRKTGKQVDEVLYDMRGEGEAANLADDTGSAAVKQKLSTMFED